MARPNQRGSWQRLSVSALRRPDRLRRAQQAVVVLATVSWMASLFFGSVVLFSLALVLLAVVMTIHERPTVSSAHPNLGDSAPPTPPTPPSRPRPPDAPVPAPLNPQPSLLAGAAKKLPEEKPKRRRASDQRPTW